MKNLLAILLFNLCFSLNAQISYNIYGTTSGIQNISPTQTTTSNIYGGYDIYDTTNGIQNLTPSQIISPNIYGGY